ncbi:hypothetical protein QJS10_CPB04g00901 [Acorus calamus]|uniref:AUGMIN subunit 3 n=1 Tax=Acorus calamus TaxID=4465 RepID=A0AAV9EWG0_ACOCL|nr:hypothetical protein QJS10_CPB04g00901 [Acorus calamus]
MEDPEKSHQHRVAELQRLRSIFGTSERQWVEAQVENAKQQAMLSVLKAQLSSDEAHIHLDLYSLRLSALSGAYVVRINYMLFKLEILKRNYFMLALGSVGDYDLRVMRQEHYMNQQKLDRCLALKQAAYETHEQGAVDDRDTFLHGVRDLLSIHSNSQGGLPAYVSAPGIIQQISGLHSDLISLRHNLEKSLPQDRNRCITSMKELEELEKVNSELFVAVDEITSEHQKKVEIFKHHQSEVHRERQVFVDFFCNPNRLRNQVRELSDHIKALHF